ncbi:glycerate kinase [Tenuibacillus multivorans]|uniref:Glycerate kinase n=1 Tax=Tenuibacillus multivorans TaxID=237069 RepID=A0A1H0B4D9_9BACI|nr:glycerate kinase [Tenuibacillus multivorans]GEL77533.1 glycerate 2-kinase [Tenuibacillus multivorans]SDN40498.1 glycerate kinase [Tenuibacillus multivorans]
MYVTVCPDSFKGSLSSKNAAKTIAKACHDVFPNAHVTQMPMADGGEGTIDALIYSTDGKRYEKSVTGPIGQPIESYFGVHGDGGTAFIEVGNTAGLIQVPEDDRNPYHTTSYGLGEMIQHVLDEGFNQIIVGLGGSATNDGGLGMLTALGAKFYDKNGQQVDYFGKDLFNIHNVDLSMLDPRLKDISIQVASDVDNPLCGERGASAIFGPQKGATNEQVQRLDQALDNYAALIEQETGNEIRNVPGAGAAGGLGFALMTVGSTLTSGAELVGQTMQLEESIAKSHLIITGEGQSDEQTLFGKAPSYVAQLAQKHHKPVVLISGSVDDPDLKLLDQFTATFSIMNMPMSLTDAMDQVEQLLYEQSIQVFNFYKTIGKFT